MYIDKIRNVYRVLVGKQKGRDQSKDLAQIVC
jgi:hypothetical protein